jgi:hypothetical protein
VGLAGAGKQRLDANRELTLLGDLVEQRLAATPAGELVDSGQPKKVRGPSMEQIARIEQEMSLVQSRLKAIRQSYNRDLMQLVLARGYVAKLLGNDAVTRWLGRHQPEVRDEFRAIASAATLDEEASR